MNDESKKPPSALHQMIRLDGKNGFSLSVESPTELRLFLGFGWSGEERIHWLERLLEARPEIVRQLDTFERVEAILDQFYFENEGHALSIIRRFRKDGWDAATERKLVPYAPPGDIIGKYTPDKAIDPSLSADKAVEAIAPKFAFMAMFDVVNTKHRALSRYYRNLLPIIFPDRDTSSSHDQKDPKSGASEDLSRPAGYWFTLAVCRGVQVNWHLSCDVFDIIGVDRVSVDLDYVVRPNSGVPHEQTVWESENLPGQDGITVRDLIRKRLPSFLARLEERLRASQAFHQERKAEQAK